MWECGTLYRRSYVSIVNVVNVVKPDYRSPYDHRAPRESWSGLPLTYMSFTRSYLSWVLVTLAPQGLSVPSVRLLPLYPTLVIQNTLALFPPFNIAKETRMWNWYPFYYNEECRMTVELCSRTRTYLFYRVNCRDRFWIFKKREVFDL